jgi:hypothetical protein
MQAFIGDKVKPEQAFPMLKYIETQPVDETDDVDPVESAQAMMRSVGVGR